MPLLIIISHNELTNLLQHLQQLIICLCIKFERIPKDAEVVYTLLPKMDFALKKIIDFQCWDLFRYKWKLFTIPRPPRSQCSWDRSETERVNNLIKQQRQFVV